MRRLLSTNQWMTARILILHPRVSVSPVTPRSTGRRITGQACASVGSDLIGCDLSYASLLCILKALNPAKIEAMMTVAKAVSEIAVESGNPVGL